MSQDPFNLSQYTSSFDKTDIFEPDALAFSNLGVEFDAIVELIAARQGSISIGFNVPDFAFTSVASYDTTTPASIVSAIELFQQAVAEMVEGTLIDTYGRLANCNVYIGFFHFENGFPIVGLSQILPGELQTDWTEPPDPTNISSVVAFTQAIGDSLNEIIFALNVLRYIHGRMVLAFELDDSCDPDLPPPPTPTPTPPTPPPPTPPTPPPPTPPTPPPPTPPTPPPPTPPTPPPPTPPTPPPPTPPTPPPPTPPTPPPPTPPTPPPPTPPTPPPPTPPTPAPSPSPPGPSPAPPFVTPSPGPGPVPAASPGPSPAASPGPASPGPGVEVFDSAALRHSSNKDIALRQGFGIGKDTEGTAIEEI